MRDIVVLPVVLLLFLGGILGHPHEKECQPPNPHKPRNVLEASDWLSRFGYISMSRSWSQGPSSLLALGEAIEVFQQLAHINITGKLDEVTLEWMGRDRCGVPDVIRRNGETRFTRNAGTIKWLKNDLTYFVTKYTRDLPRAEVDRTLAAAFKVWSDVTPLTFTKIASRDNVDMEIKFVHGVHGDNNPFDGVGGVLAHAFFPPNHPSNVIGGDTHFDEAESWTIELDDDAPGRRLFCVAVHEFGHALGLDHSDQQGSIMWPWSQGCRNGTLDPSDIQNIQRLYGPPGSRTTTQSTTTRLTTIPSTRMRTVKPTRKPTKTKKPSKPTKKPRVKPTKRPRRTRKPTKVTKQTTRPTKRPTTRKRVPPRRKTTVKPSVKTTKRRPAPTEPTTQKVKVTTRKRVKVTTPRPRPRPTHATRRRIKTTPTTTPMPTTTQHPVSVCRGNGTMDAIDVASDGHTYGFKGNLIFRIENGKIAQGFPKPISEIFSPGPSSVDAAVSFYYKTRWTRRLKQITYLFKDNLVWRYEYKRRNLLKVWEDKVFDVVGGYPRKLVQDFGIREDRIDAAFKLMKKNSIYITKGYRVWEVQIHRSGLKTKKDRLLLKDPALSYLPPLDSAARFNAGGFFFFSGDFFHQLLPLDRKRARWFWPRYTLNDMLGCNLDNLEVPLEVRDRKFSKEVKTKGIMH